MVAGSIPGSNCPHTEVSSGQTMNPKLLPTSLAVFYMTAATSQADITIFLLCYSANDSWPLKIPAGERQKLQNAAERGLDREVLSSYHRNHAAHFSKPFPHIHTQEESKGFGERSIWGARLHWFIHDEKPNVPSLNAPARLLMSLWKSPNGNEKTTRVEKRKGTPSPWGHAMPQHTTQTSAQPSDTASVCRQPPLSAVVFCAGICCTV